MDYKSGRSNVVADALSRKEHEGSSLMVVSMPQLSLFDAIHQEQQGCPSLQQLIEDTQKGNASPHWNLKNGLLFFKNCVYLDSSFASIQSILSALHNKGHEGYQKNLFQNTQDFYWKGMKNHVRDFVRGCVICQ